MGCEDEKGFWTSAALAADAETIGQKVRELATDRPKPWHYPAAHTEGTVDMVNHPPHYEHPSGIECIQVTEFMSFTRGSAVKYLWRAGSKGGGEQELEDLRKARWYIEREIANLEKKAEQA